MKKYCDLYYTTKKHLKGERNNRVPIYHYSYTLWDGFNKTPMQSSLDNEEGEQYYDSEQEAEQQAKEAIQDHYV
jgi:hypothetical protein